MIIADYSNNVIRKNSQGTLAVSLLSFTAEKAGKSSLLNWQTTFEQNNAFFSIEHSLDGKKFSSIGKVLSQGNSNLKHEYSFTDNYPFVGINYYRLKQINNDGTFIYSTIVSIDFASTINLKLYPNPVKDILTIYGFPDDNKTTISIINSSGKILSVYNTTNNSIELNIK